jgi:hypothetical protein
MKDGSAWIQNYRCLWEVIKPVFYTLTRCQCLVTVPASSVRTYCRCDMNVEGRHANTAFYAYLYMVNLPYNYASIVSKHVIPTHM